jgi:carbonic anhydrase
MSAKKPGRPSDVSKAAPVDFTYRFQPSRPKAFFVPEDADQAVAELRKGNEKIVRFFEACQSGRPAAARAQVVNLSRLEVRGEPKGADGLPMQLPFAVVVGCADARVPAELLFGQEFNDIFNIRVAGNVLAPECIGSLLYALRSFVADGPGENLRGLKLAVALGHRGCGGVKETIKAFQSDPTGATIPSDPVGSILRRIFTPAVTIGAMALDEVLGAGASIQHAFAPEFIELAVYLNAAWVAHEMSDWVALQGGEAARKVEVVFGVADPGDLRVRAVPPGTSTPLAPAGAMFARPPRSLDELHQLALDIIAGFRRPGGTQEKLAARG